MTKLDLATLSTVSGGGRSKGGDTINIYNSNTNTNTATASNTSGSSAKRS